VIRSELLLVLYAEKEFSGNIDRICILFQDEFWDIDLMRRIAIDDVWDVM